MTRKWTRQEAFGSFGVKLRNYQWSWSARSEDGNTVVLTVWQDLFRRQEDGRLIYLFPALSDAERRGGGNTTTFPMS
jgi:hypothetical protein